MEAHNHTVEHFRLMAEPAARLESIPALVVKHHYQYEVFGSWWLAFKRRGERFRVGFDGRDGYLRLDREAAGRGPGADAWEELAGKPLAEAGGDTLAGEANSLIAGRP